MGLFDLPATIDYILRQTGHPQLYFVGHSQGTTNLMVLLSEKPEYNKFIVAASLLAPVAYLGHSNYIFQTLAQISPLLMVIQKKNAIFYKKKLYIKLFRRRFFRRNFCPDNHTLMYWDRFVQTTFSTYAVSLLISCSGLVSIKGMKYGKSTSKFCIQFQTIYLFTNFRQWWEEYSAIHQAVGPPKCSCTMHN